MRELLPFITMPERAGPQAESSPQATAAAAAAGPGASDALFIGPIGQRKCFAVTATAGVAGRAPDRLLAASETPVRAPRARILAAVGVVAGLERRMDRRLLLQAGLAGAATMGAAFIRPALAQTSGWPTKPVRLMVGFGGGSSPDLVARVLTEPLSKALGQPVIVDNHAGASGNIAADIVAKSTDQHTLGILINGNMTTAKLLNPATPYDPHKDLAPINLLCTAPLVLVAPAAAPGRSGQEFFAAAREAGNRWNYGSPGMGTIGHLGMELLKARTGIAPVHVPYLGNPQVVNALLSGHIHLALLPPGLALAQAGKLRAIGVTSTTPSPLVPLAPPLQELGARDFQLEIWTAAAGPATLAPELVQRLSQLLSSIVKQPQVREKLFQQGYQAAGLLADDFAKRLRHDTAQVRALIDSGAVKVE